MYLCSARTLVNRIRGFNSLQLAKYKDAYERDRLFTMILYNTQIKHALKKPSELITFAWEQKQNKVQLSKEAFLKFID
jgi:fructose-specific phosphotransferase system component IIB